MKFILILNIRHVQIFHPFLKICGKNLNNQKKKNKAISILKNRSPNTCDAFKNALFSFPPIILKYCLLTSKSLADLEALIIKKSHILRSR